MLVVTVSGKFVLIGFRVSTIYYNLIWKSGKLCKQFPTDEVLIDDLLRAYYKVDCNRTMYTEICD